MKFLMSRDELCTLVGGLQFIVSQRSPMPILSNILIEAHDTSVTMTATDLTVGVRCVGVAKVLESGATTIPAKRFAQLIKELHSAYVEVSSNEQEMCYVNADASTFRIPGMSKADFPFLPDISTAPKIILRQKDLKKSLFHTSFAIAKEESRYVLMGIFMKITPEQVLFVATDGKRLARTVVPAQTDETKAFECVIPSKAIVELQNTLVDSDENVVVYLLNDKIAFSFNNRIVITKLLAGEFPDAERIIPQQVSTVVAIHREEVSSLLRQVSLFTDAEKTSVQFAFSENSLQISANAADVGEGKVSMAVHYDATPIEISFNPVFLLDVLRHSYGEYMYMGIQDASNPVILSDVEFESVLTKYPAPLFILMPLRPNIV